MRDVCNKEKFPETERESLRESQGETISVFSTGQQPMKMKYFLTAKEKKQAQELVGAEAGEQEADQAFPSGFCVLRGGAVC